MAVHFKVTQTTIASLVLVCLIGRAHAAPQGINFAVVDIAAPVASGPLDNGIPSQSASLQTSFTVDPVASPTGSVQARSLTKRDLAISQSSRNAAYDASLGTFGQTTTVQPGVTYWLSGGSIHDFFGNIDNSGNIVVSQTDFLKQYPYGGGQTSDWVGHDANNGNLKNAQGALIMLNDIGSASAPTYDWYLHSMINNGTIQWCGRGDTGGSTYQMYSDNDATNNGLISYEQAFSNFGASFVWRNPVLTPGTVSGSNLYNNGAFRLINIVYHNVQNVYGSGCWEIGKGGVLYLEDGTGVFQNPTKGPSFPNQSIYFQDSSAVLHMDTAVYSLNSAFGPKVFGFGSGNAIEFFQIITKFGYDAGSGNLQVSFLGGNSVSIKLGPGYNASLFAKKNNPQKYNVIGYNAIFYNGPAPAQNVPSVCSISYPVCSQLSGDFVPPSTSTSVSLTFTALSSTSSAISSSVSTSTRSVASSSLSSTTASSATPASSTISISKASSTASSSSTSSSIASVSVSNTVSSSAPSSTFSTATDSAGQPCPTTPEQCTYCGFINPQDPCAPQPDGYGPVPTPDTPSAFLAFSTLHALANSAPTEVPSTQNQVYQQTFKDLNAASSAQSYLGLQTLHSYNVSECAAYCDATNLCTAFNIYIERDPSLNPTANDSTAPTIWGYWYAHLLSSPPSFVTNFAAQVSQASSYHKLQVHTVGLIPH